MIVSLSPIFEGAVMAEFYFNVDTGQVEEGRQSSGTELMGPYASRAEAQQALTTAAQRNEKWDAEDAAWEGEDRS